MEWELQPGRDERLAGNLDTSLLKTLALLFMLIDHLGVALFGNLLEMRVLGRIALPLYAWCLVVGNVKTRHPLRYFGRLLLLAAISQPLYMMALNHTWQHLNILFLLALATAAIQGIRLHRYGSQFWGPALCYLALGFCEIDYGWRGLTFILLLYPARESRGGLAAAFLEVRPVLGLQQSGGHDLSWLQSEFPPLARTGRRIHRVFPSANTGVAGASPDPHPHGQRRENAQMAGVWSLSLHLVLLIVLRLWFGGATWAGIASCF
ncbi:MAG: TraX family protein [Lachnospiraceae bacterium]